MGKYTTYNIATAKPEWAQANELAEANRIKRLELRMRAIETKIQYHFSEEIDELEDLA